jgi:hypothetical protein
MFLRLSGQIEGQLREAYDRKFKAGLATQSSLAAKLGVNRSAIHHRLMGHTNMTTESIADMVWALDHDIKVEIFDPSLVHGLNSSIPSSSTPQPAPPARAQPMTPAPARDPDFVKSLREQAGSPPTPPAAGLPPARSAA